MREITVHLRLSRSEQLREHIQLLLDNDFTIIKTHMWRNEVSLIKSTDDLVFTDSDIKNSYLVCIYNGHKSLDDSYLIRKKLEENPAIILRIEEKLRLP